MRYELCGASYARHRTFRLNTKGMRKDGSTGVKVTTAVKSSIVNNGSPTGNRPTKEIDFRSESPVVAAAVVTLISSPTPASTATQNVVSPVSDSETKMPATGTMSVAAVTTTVATTVVPAKLSDSDDAMGTTDGSFGPGADKIQNDENKENITVTNSDKDAAVNGSDVDKKTDLKLLKPEEEAYEGPLMVDTAADVKVTKDAEAPLADNEQQEQTPLGNNQSPGKPPDQMEVDGDDEELPKSIDDIEEDFDQHSKTEEADRSAEEYTDDLLAFQIDADAEKTDGPSIGKDSEEESDDFDAERDDDDTEGDSDGPRVKGIFKHGAEEDEEMEEEEEEDEEDDDDENDYDDGEDDEDMDDSVVDLSSSLEMSKADDKTDSIGDIDVTGPADLSPEKKSTVAALEANQAKDKMRDVDDAATTRGAQEAEKFNQETEKAVETAHTKELEQVADVGIAKVAEKPQEGDKKVDAKKGTESEKSTEVVKVKEAEKIAEVAKTNVKGSAMEQPVEIKQEQEQDHEMEHESAPTLEEQVKASSATITDANSDQEKEPPTVQRDRKRRRSATDPNETDQSNEETMAPAKKLKTELDTNFPVHDRVLSNYIKHTNNDTMKEIDRQIEGLAKELQSLNDTIRAKELEWNSLLHMKKVKEEIMLRLNRKKNVTGIMNTELGEVSDYAKMDSCILSNNRSFSVEPRPPTPPPEVDVRPASVSTALNYSNRSTNSDSINRIASNVMLFNRRYQQQHLQQQQLQQQQENLAPKGSNSNNFVSQFNRSNSSVTMVPLSTGALVNSRASMNKSECVKEQSFAMEIQQRILPLPAVLPNHQQIMTNLAVSAGLSAANNAAEARAGNPGHATLSNSTHETATNATFASNILANLRSQALLNGHHNPGTAAQQSSANQLQVGRQGVIKPATSIIADYRQQNPGEVPRRGRRVKNMGHGSYRGGNAVSVTALGGTGSTSFGRSGSSTDHQHLSMLLATAENSRPSSNDSSQSNSNAMSAGGGLTNGISFNDVLVQFAKIRQNDPNLLSTLNSLTNASNSPSSVTQSSPANLSKNAYPEVTLHPVMNSTALSELNHSGSNHNTSSMMSPLGHSLANANRHHSNNSGNSLLEAQLRGNLSKHNPRSDSERKEKKASSYLQDLLTQPERINSQTSTVTSGALANLQSSVAGGLNFSKNNNEITITPVVTSNLQQSLFGQQQQQQQQQQYKQQEQKRYHRGQQHHFKREGSMGLDDEADDSADRLVIDEGDDHSTRELKAISKRSGHEIVENEIPACQGCKKQEAKFVCAGCTNQWYCCRECQINSWDEHSDVCTG